MTVRRLSTLTFARRLAAHLPDGQKLLQALHRPQVADILETLDRHDHGRFFILGPFQVVKSLIGQLHLARNHWINPVKAGWYGPTDKFQAEFYRGKLERLLAASPDLALCKFLKPGANRAHLRPESFDTNRYTVSRHTYTEDATHQLLSAATEPDRTGRTLQHTYYDEVHLWTPGWIRQIQNRHGDYIETENWKDILMSTGLNRGETEGAEATEIWDQTDQRTWHTRCPHCQKLSEDRLIHRYGESDFSLLDEMDRARARGASESELSTLNSQLSTQRGSSDPDAPLLGGYFYDRATLPNGHPDHTLIAATLRYVCPRCSTPDPTPGARRYRPTCSLPDSTASRELLSGTFDHPRGLYLAKNAHPYPAHYGWNFTALTVRPWIDVILNWEKAQHARARGDLEPLAKVIREDLAGIWHPLKEMKDTRHRPKGGYPMADLTKWGRTPLAA